MGFGGCEGVADTLDGDCRGETETELRGTMEKMDGYRIPREGEWAATVREAISYYLQAATFPFPSPTTRHQCRVAIGRRSQGRHGAASSRTVALVGHVGG